MLKSIKMGLLCFCVINLSVACSSEDPSITDETPGQNTGNGGNENEGGEEETPAETRYAFPGAYGAGRYTTGGAGGEVYKASDFAFGATDWGKDYTSLPLTSDQLFPNGSSEDLTFGADVPEEYRVGDQRWNK